MEKVFKYWANCYYLEPVLLLVLIITLVVSWRKRKSLPQLKLFPVYLFFFIGLLISYYIIILSVSNKVEFRYWDKICKQYDYVVTLVEFITFCYFFHYILKTPKFKKAIIWISTSVLILMLLIYLYSLTYRGVYSIQENHIIYIIESTTLLLFCAFYYIELFRLSLVKNPLKSSDFWVCSGLMSYLICTLPGTIILDNMFAQRPIYNYLYTIIYICYVLFFLTIIKAYNLKK